MERVRDLMSAAPRVVSPSTRLSDCAQMMLAGRLRCLAVVDDEGLVGLLTDASVFGRGHYEGGEWAFGDQRADEAALPAFPLAHDAPAAKGVRKLIGREAAVVLDGNGVVVGMLSEHDAVRLAPALIPAFRAVGEVASRPVSTVMAHVPAVDAWEALRASGHRHLVVTDPHGVATDVLSLRDLVRAGIQPDDLRTVSQICAQTVLHTVNPDLPVQAAARRMAELGVGCLPSVDARGQPVAILTRSDVLRVLAETLADPALFATDAGPRVELFPFIRELRGPAPQPALRALVEALPRHFGQETGPDGLFARLEAAGCPEPVVEGFRVQHGALAESLRALAAADPTDPAWDGLRIRFANELEAHEFEESRAHLAADGD